VTRTRVILLLAGLLSQAYSIFDTHLLDGGAGIVGELLKRVVQKINHCRKLFVEEYRVDLLNVGHLYAESKKRGAGPKQPANTVSSAAIN